MTAAKKPPMSSATRIQGRKSTDFRGQSGYAEARREFNPRFDYFPEVVVFCRDTADVKNAVRWARKRGVPIRLRCGRHSYEAYSTTDNAIVIDVSRLEAFTIAADRKSA